MSKVTNLRDRKVPDDAQARFYYQEVRKALQYAKHKPTCRSLVGINLATNTLVSTGHCTCGLAEWFREYEP